MNQLLCPMCNGDADESGTPGRVTCFFCGYEGPPAPPQVPFRTYRTQQEMEEAARKFLSPRR